MIIKDLLKQWLEYKKELNKRRTIERYEGLITKHINPVLGNKDIESTKKYEIQSFLLERKKNGKNQKEMSASTINIILTILHSAFEYAIDMEIIDKNPCLRIKKIPDKGKKVEAFTREEQRRLEIIINNNQDSKYFGIKFCLYTGLRIGELCALEWSDFDFEKGTVSIQKSAYMTKINNKTVLYIDTVKTYSSNRIIPLNEQILKELKTIKKKSKSECLIEDKKGKRVLIRTYQYFFMRLTTKAKVRKLNFHALRHTFATRALESGVDIKTLSEIMGHKNASITLNRYVHSMLDTKKEMMNKMQYLV